uniref:Sulfopyruvate decarboxylase subunit beta n=1 Tax=Candidatus Kentrum sp. TUN TaxID=2126343 RepID=A0A450ZRT8_9GAMM|nr:MAG: sulfopyruvate decarboxylase subunit beta [Candidatus Kentron sp. TUN]VFK62887.1 MAG: sulfopyruvate decarboxylase subunit beta [Candidatus Kentron sp. TUN]
MIQLHDTVEFLFKTRARDQLFVFGIGDISKAGYAAGFPTDIAFFMVGAWGLPASFGIGLAIANPNARIVVIDGDGAFLHSPNHLSLLASLQVTNYHFVIVNNGIYRSSGGQRIMALDQGIEIEKIISAHGFSNIECLSDQNELPQMNRESPGPAFTVVRTTASQNRYPRVPLEEVRNSFTPSMHTCSRMTED